MGVKIDLFRGVQENAAAHYGRAKELREKVNGLEKAILDTTEKLKKGERKAAGAKKKTVRVARKKEWYESFHWSFTNSGKLVLVGKDAKQNDLLVARHMDEKDLFFHADIKGGAATILKGGAGADEEEKKYAAVLAASFSKAWMRGFAGVDTYCVKKEQLSKHAQGGFVGAGGFAIVGQKEWFKNTPLGLKVGVDKEGRGCAGAPSADWMVKSVSIVPGGKEKGAALKEIAYLLGVDESEVAQVLPSGKISVRKE